MGRPPPVRLNRPIDKPATLSAARAVTESPRDVEELGRLRELLTLGQGLAAWVCQFDAASPATLLAAGAVGHHGRDAVLLYIEDTLARLAPHADRGAVARTSAPAARGEQQRGKPETSDAPVAVTANAWQQAREQLCKTINTFRFVREHVGGNLRSEPEIAYPYDESTDDVAWHDAWEPADEETAVVALTRFARATKHRLRQRDEAKAQRVHDRIASVGRDVLQAFVQTIRVTKSAEGLPHIGELIDQLPSGRRKARAKRALKKVSLLTDAVLQLVPAETDGDPTSFGKPFQEFFAADVIARFMAAGREYAQTCLPLLNKPKGSLQAIRKKVLRHFATVAQYAYMASGNGWYGRFAELLAAVDVFAHALQADVKALLDAPSASQQEDTDSIRNVVEELNKRIVDAGVAKRWAAAMGGRAAFYGRFIGEIATSEGVQAEPWDRGDVVPTLSRAGLITAKGKNGRGKAEAVTDACVLMQQVGLAAQVPFSYLLDDAGSPPKRMRKGGSPFAHDGLPWVVNPLGMVLCSYGKAATGKRESRPRRANSAAAVDGATGPRIAALPAANSSRGKTKRTAAAKRKPRQALPKAAKKWPRA